MAGSVLGFVAEGAGLADGLPPRADVMLEVRPFQTPARESRKLFEELLGSVLVEAAGGVGAMTTVELGAGLV
jgi:hypothetical protein